MTGRVLVVDDDKSLRLALEKALRRKGLDVVLAHDGEEAIAPLLSGKDASGAPLDVCVLDLRMPKLDGIAVLQKTLGRLVPVVVLTGHGTIEDAVLAMRYGATNFVQKPVDADALLPVLTQAIAEGKKKPTSRMLGASPALTAFLEKIDRAARTEEPVLLLGETGTGKELAARRVHDLSSRADAPFVAFNAACVPKELFESELFGHMKGAFTGAQGAREGLLALAADGTLFIDEIGDLPPDAQAKLLRALEDRRFRPVGSDAERPFRARVVAATHQDLARMVEDGRFRADLYYRLSVVPLRLPSLAQRGDDIVLIARAILADLSTSERPLSLSREAEARLLAHRFPGNVRELINLMKRAAILSDDAVIGDATIARLLDENPFTVWASARPAEPEQPSTLDARLQAGARVTLEELEKAHICRLLDELSNVSEVARIVGIDRRTLQRKMIAWGLRQED